MTMPADADASSESEAAALHVIGSPADSGFAAAHAATYFASISGDDPLPNEVSATQVFLPTDSGQASAGVKDQQRHSQEGAASRDFPSPSSCESSNDHGDGDMQCGVCVKYVKEGPQCSYCLSSLRETDSSGKHSPSPSPIKPGTHLRGDDVVARRVGAQQSAEPVAAARDNIVPPIPANEGAEKLGFMERLRRARDARDARKFQKRADETAGGQSSVQSSGVTTAEVQDTLAGGRTSSWSRD
jgi:hypothetical protein